MRSPSLLLAALIALALGVSACASDDEPRAERDRGVAAPAPDPGPVGEPAQTRQVRNLRRALARARPGDTIVLRPGVYGRRGTVLSLRRSGRPGRPITIRGPARGKRPRFLGQVRVDGDNLRLRRLLFDGPTGRVLRPDDDNPGGEDVQVWIRGDNVTLSDSEVRHNRWHAGIYITADNPRIVRNYVHDNGDPRNANLDHGVYWDSGRGGILSDNLIVRNVAYGVHLYSQPRGVRVLHNTLSENGRAGLIVAERTAGSLIANNIVAYNGSPIVAFGLSGGGNALVRNLFWDNGGAALEIEEDGSDVATEGNVVADPGFVEHGNYRLLPESGAQGKAAPEYTTERDVEGAQRPRNGADLGAYELR